MILLGIILVVLGWLLPVPLLLTLGLVLIVVGVILELLGTAGVLLLGRRHWY